MKQEIHDLTMLYLQKHIPDNVEVEDLARLYYERYNDVSKRLATEVKRLEKEGGVKHISF